MAYRIRHNPTGKYFKKRGTVDWEVHWALDVKHDVNGLVNDVGSIHEKLATIKNVFESMPNNGEWSIVEIDIKDVGVVE
jgi:hypothetical protein